MGQQKTKSKKRDKPKKAKKPVRGVLDLPKAVEVRMDEGRAEREAVPLEAHGEWVAPEDRPDPVAVLEEQNVTRVPELVPIRHGRMIVSPFTFYRGGAAIMAWDLSRTPTTGLRVQCCGDAHLSNFGVFAAPDRRMVFDLNDFDETLPAPFEWDVKRLVASFVVAARDNRHTRQGAARGRAHGGGELSHDDGGCIDDALHGRLVRPRRRRSAARRARPERRQGDDEERPEEPRQGAQEDEPRVTGQVRRGGRRRVQDQGGPAGHRAPAGVHARRVRGDRPPGT